MAGISSERAHDVREALRTIVSDPQHGGLALSNPHMMSNLLKDLLPDAPRETNLLVAAAEANLAGMMRDQVGQGIDAGSAVRLAAASFGATTHFTDTACTWVATELATALDLGSGLEDAVSLPPGEITRRAATVPDATAAAETEYVTEAAGGPSRPAAARAAINVAAILVLLGAVGLLLGYEFPVVYDPAPARILTTLPFWTACFPLIALVAAAVSGVLLLRRRGGQMWRAAAGAMAAVSGLELLVFFVAVNDKFVSSYGDRRGIGLVVGVLASVLLIVGGVMELSRQVRVSRELR